MQFDAFISYSGADKPTADAACATLEAAGIRCWIAPRDIMPGREYGDALVDALDHCRVLVLVFSSRANTSPQIRREVERVVSRGVPVLPLRIEDVLPTRSMAYFVGSVHWLDALTPPLEQHLQRLAGAVQALLRVDPAGAGRIPDDDADAGDAPPPAAGIPHHPVVQVQAAKPGVAEDKVAPRAAPHAVSSAPGPANDGGGQSAAALAHAGASTATAAPAERSLEAATPPAPAALRLPAVFLLLFGVARCLATIAFWSVLANRHSPDSIEFLLLAELLASGVAAIAVGWSLRRAHRVRAVEKIICGLGALSEAGWFIFAATLIVGGGIAGAAILFVILPSPFGVAAFIWGFINLRRKQTASI